MGMSLGQTSICELWMCWQPLMSWMWRTTSSMVQGRRWPVSMSMMWVGVPSPAKQTLSPPISRRSGVVPSAGVVPWRANCSGAWSAAQRTNFSGMRTRAPSSSTSAPASRKRSRAGFHSTLIPTVDRTSIEAAWMRSTSSWLSTSNRAVFMLGSPLVSLRKLCPVVAGQDNEGRMPLYWDGCGGDSSSSPRGGAIRRTSLGSVSCQLIRESPSLRRS